jgi:RES domain-containing protein
VIEVFRLGPSRFLDGFWSGDGGLHVDGRWHTQGRRIIYAAQSLSLAQLEVLVHITDRRQLPDLIQARAVIPDDLTILTIDVAGLPADWRRFSPYCTHTQQLGTQWLIDASSAVLKVPSAISEHEWNYLLNPGHPDSRRLRLSEPQPFVMDPRVP